ncbi:MAG: thymidine phosphorylase, partial [Clostridia bacterium]|nr:thymidine phosphorylase [Clostridia bacterium]
GTIDKLEAIPGFNTSLAMQDFERIVNETGIAIVGQSAELAPADKKLYALRDVTATIECMPLIASSIMGKKLAADDDCIVLDVKTGSGSFMKTIEDSKALARIMVDIGKNAGKRTLALITDMDIPLGNAIGNTLEVKEAIEVLKGNGPKDLTEVCLCLASNMLYLAEKGSLEECEKMANEAISNGKALETFVNMVKAQGGDYNCVLHPENFKVAKYSHQVKAPKSGYIYSVNTEGYGVASLLLGAGRNVKEDVIDFSAGIILNAKTGDYVNEGDLIATLYSDKDSFAQSEQKLIDSTVISDNAPQKRPLVLAKVE